MLYRIELRRGDSTVGLFEGLSDWHADAVNAMMNRAHVIAPDDLRPFKHSRKRFFKGKYWFTDRGWLACGKRIYRYLQSERCDVVLLTLENESGHRVVFRDQYQVSMLFRDQYQVSMLGGAT